MESSRLPGKPLIKIDGKTMIQRVYESVNKSMLFDKVIVATPNMEIYDHVEVFGDVILTSNNPLNGTLDEKKLLFQFGEKFKIRKYLLNN